MSSPRNRKRDHYIVHSFPINKWRYPPQTHSMCFDHSSGTVSSEEYAYLKSISNTNSPQCDCGFNKQSRSHTSRNVPESNDRCSFLKLCISRSTGQITVKGLQTKHSEAIAINLEEFCHLSNKHYCEIK